MFDALKALRYEGKALEHQDGSGRRIPPYYPSDELVEAVNLAIYLKRPLLLKGEPGCGKTRLAKAVADELGLPYQAWYIQSTSRAKDGLYTFDTVARLRDAQLAHTGYLDDGKDIQDPTTYRQFGPLGKAINRQDQPSPPAPLPIRRTQACGGEGSKKKRLNQDKRTVLLIDEIDKADIDFPNDLLRVLDELRFDVPETGEKIEAAPDHAPIIFITSNSERSLPAPFLRRCLFHYIEFPKDLKRLEKIVRGHFPAPSDEWLEPAIARFQALRQEMVGDKREGEKKVSTSELLDWVNVLHQFADDEMLQELRSGGLPFASVLLKSWPDHRRYLGEQELPQDESDDNDQLPELWR